MTSFILPAGPNPAVVPAQQQPVAVLIGNARPAFRGFGFACYAQMTGTGPITLDPGVRTLVSMTLDPAQTNNQLHGPFAGFIFWDGTTFRVRDANDSLRVRFGLSATALVAGGNLRLEAQIIGASTPLDTQDKTLPNQANTLERVNYELDLFSGASFAANGLRFYLTASVPISVQNETIKVTPDFAGAP